MTFKAPFVVAMMGITLGLTGCGGSDDNGSYNSNLGNGNSNNGNTSAILKYNIFNREYDDSGVTTPSNLTRDEITFATGGVSIATKGLLKSYAPPTDEGYDHEIGDHFLESHLDNDVSFAKNVVVTKTSSDKYSVTYNTVSNNNQSIAHTMIVKEIDISGVYNFAQKEAQGFHTWADNERFSKLPDSITYPTGSSCFVFEQQNQDKVTYGFEDANVTDYTDLDSFVNAQYQVVAGSVKKYNVGLNNEWQVTEYQQSYSDSPSYAVFYNGKVYESAYKNDLTETENSDITKGEVTCENLNPVAADTMEQALLKAYK